MLTSVFKVDWLIFTAIKSASLMRRKMMFDINLKTGDDVDNGFHVLWFTW